MDLNEIINYWWSRFFRLSLAEYFFHPKVNIEEGIKIVKENINYWKNAPIWTKDKIKIATKDWFKHLKK